MMRKPHPSVRDGSPCYCTFLVPGDPTGGYGKHASKTASKLDWLRERPDLQTPEGQEWLDYLQMNHAHADPLLPWLTREWKRGRIYPDSPHVGYDQYGGTGQLDP